MRLALCRDPMPAVLTLEDHAPKLGAFEELWQFFYEELLETTPRVSWIVFWSWS